MHYQAEEGPGKAGKGLLGDCEFHGKVRFQLCWAELEPMAVNTPDKSPLLSHILQTNHIKI